MATSRDKAHAYTTGPLWFSRRKMHHGCRCTASFKLTRPAQRSERACDHKIARDGTVHCFRRTTTSREVVLRTLFSRKKRDTRTSRRMRAYLYFPCRLPGENRPRGCPEREGKRAYTPPQGRCSQCVRPSDASWHPDIPPVGAHAS